MVNQGNFVFQPSNKLQSLSNCSRPLCEHTNSSNHASNYELSYNNPHTSNCTQYTDERLSQLRQRRPYWLDVLWRQNLLNYYAINHSNMARDKRIHRQYNLESK